MFFKPKKKYVVTALAVGFLFVGTSFKNDFFEIAKQIEIFTTLYKTVNTNYVDETNPGELMDKAIKNMLADLDPYTVYFNEQDVAKFKINNTGEYTGIGAQVTRKDGRLIIKEPYKGYAADKAGLKAGDEIIQIGDINLVDFKEDTRDLLKGTRDTKFDIKYKRQGKIYDAQLVLDEVDLRAVPYFSMVDENTGYIVLSQFNNKASKQTKEALVKLKEDGATKIILDLRGNPGGLLNEAVNVCNIFLPRDEIIVTTKSKNKKYNNIYKTKKEPVDTEIPLVVLVNGKSASASEIVSGALQDLDRAVVVGSRSFGKGLVQRPLELTYGTQVKVTISRYYTPSGRGIQALDYTRKDEEGNAIRIDKKDYNAFKTRKGRTVYDGGGILPDVVLEESKQSAITDALERNSAIFNFVTEYYYKNPNLGTTIPKLSDSDFNDFKKYLKKEGFEFETQTEKALKEAYEIAIKEKIDGNIATEYKGLLNALKKSQEKEINTHKKEIKKLMLDEIIKRYQYKEGLYKYYTTSNPEIIKSTTLLNNTNEYNKILLK
ncbi:MAG: peptidase S41 [Flavobacterium sp. MedPE-SWcel]|uniref:S41 family peptidase n=1 Tax=uncultured Flavobacterium sp. TaxID=165435 RepID=UPI00090F69E2|nr:S41 family peptidase [uncultured Flavobacterium sp.]OIQ15600.1 MAG: peptidase S41 [Flavobacterium sp. MedPE-SWcel]